MLDLELARYYCKDFWEEEGGVSCFECDIIFYDLEKLYEHQLIHLREEVKKDGKQYLPEEQLYASY